MTDSALLPHQPVLLAETLAALKVQPDGVYLDATFGRGGHTAAILEQLGPQGRLLALDRDPAAEQCAAMRFGADPRFTFVRTAFSCVDQVVKEYGWMSQIAGVLLDLGVSSPQLDDPDRGFSFSQDGPLDMRMDPDTGYSAAAWLAPGQCVKTGAGADRIWRRAISPACRPRSYRSPPGGANNPHRTVSRHRRCCCADPRTGQTSSHPDISGDPHCGQRRIAGIESGLDGNT
jgi:hypothetical protein